MKDMGKSSSRKLRWAIYYTLCRMDPNKNVLKHKCLHNNLTTSENYTARLPFGSKQRKVLTKSSLYKIYRAIVFQKVALGYFLHFVQNGSSKNVLKTRFCTTISSIHNLPGSASIWEHQKT